jgi:uncharacterized protein YndB with AHSA1/START domain
MTQDTDRITKTALLAAPLERVWRAISDAQQFGTWFGAAFDGPFVPGARLSGRIVPTQVDADVAKMQEPHAGTKFEVFVERVEPMRLLSFRWHPYGVEAKDFTVESTTTVEFELTPVPEGIRLTITESGFDGLPPERRAQAFASNQEGWVHQLALIAKYLAGTVERRT